MIKWNERATKWITPRNMELFLKSIYFISLIPLFLIGFYNYPSADDYTNGSACHHAFLSGESIFGVIGVALKRMIDEWHIWRGGFTVSFLSNLVPSVFGEKLYVLTIWIVIGMLTVSTWYFLKVLFVKVFQADKHSSCCVIWLVLFVTVHCMVGRNEALYWYSGAINYTFVHGMSLLFYGLLISCVYDSGKKRMGYLIAASCVGFLTGGGNQMTALNVAIIMVTVMIGISCQKKWKCQRCLLIPIGMFLIGFFLNVAAPGNLVRAENATGMSPIVAIMTSLQYCLKYCIGEWSQWPIFVLVFALVPLFWHMAQRTEFSFRYPMLVILFGYGIVSAMMTPPLFALGNFVAGRLQALTFMMYILVLVLCVGYVTGWARHKWKELGHDECNEKFTVNEIKCMLAAILFLGVGVMLMVIPEPHYFTFSSAITDLTNGSAKVYADVLEERTKLYCGEEKDVVVKPLTEKPLLLYFSDINENPENWENKGVCRFYGLNSVKSEKNH